MSQEHRKIIHIDMDCFYAAVETHDFPELAGKPIGIGGGERGVLCTSNYEARKFGVRAAMPTRMALSKCPHLILRPPRFERYREIAKLVREIFHRHTEIVEPLSLDEAFLDVSKNKDFSGSATWLAKSIKKEIKQKTGLTASAGVAPNKFLAKIASDWNKPDGLFTISPADVKDFLLDLPVKNIFGVGKVTQEHLKRWNIITCGDLQKWDEEELIKEFGNHGKSLYQYARGIDHREVCAKYIRKSLSVENTFQVDLDLEALLEQLPSLYAEFIRRLDSHLKNEKRPLKTMTVKLKTFDFTQFTMDASCTSIPEKQAFEKMIVSLYQKANASCRLMGVGVRFEEPDALRSLQTELF